MAAWEIALPSGVGLRRSHVLSGEVDLFEIAGESQGGRVDTTIGGSAVVLENSTVAIEGAVLKVTFGALTGVAPRSPALILTDPSGVIASSVVSVGPDGAITTRTSLVDATLTGFDLSTDFIPNLLGTRVLLRNGAQAANVIVSPGFVPFAGLGPTNTVNVAGASGAVLIVDGSTSEVRLAPPSQ